MCKYIALSISFKLMEQSIASHISVHVHIKKQLKTLSYSQYPVFIISHIMFQFVVIFIHMLLVHVISLCVKKA